MIPEETRKKMYEMSSKILDHLQNALKSDDTLTPKDLRTIQKTMKLCVEMIEKTKPENGKS